MAKTLTVVCSLSALWLVGCGVVFAVNDMTDLAVEVITVGILTLIVTAILYQDSKR